MRLKSRESCRRDQAISIRTHHHICRQGVAFSGTRQLRSQGSVSVYAHRTKGVTGFKGREGGNGVGGAIGVGGGDGDGKRSQTQGMGTWTSMGTKTERK